MIFKLKCNNKLYYLCTIFKKKYTCISTNNDSCTNQSSMKLKSNLIIDLYIDLNNLFEFWCFLKFMQISHGNW